MSQIIEYDMNLDKITIRNMTKSENASQKLAAEEFAQMAAQSPQVDQSIIAAKQAGVAKLIALGLTEEEAKAVVGVA